MNCPDPEQLMAYLQFELDDDDWHQVHQHLQECETCQQELSSVAEFCEALADADTAWVKDPEAVLPQPDADHITDDDLKAFAEGHADEALRLQVLPHLSRCAHCMNRVAEYTRAHRETPAEPSKEMLVDRVSALAEIALSWVLDIDLLKPPSELKLALTMGQERDARATEDGVLQCSVTVPATGKELAPDEEVEGQISVRLDPSREDLVDAVLHYRIYDGEQLAYEGEIQAEGFRGTVRRALRRARNDAYHVIVEVVSSDETAGRSGDE